MRADPVSALASRPASLNLSAMSQLSFDRPPAAAPLDRQTLLARFDGIRQFARGGRRAPHKPLLLLYALARLKRNQVQRDRGDREPAASQLRSLGQRSARLLSLRTPRERWSVAPARSHPAPRRQGQRPRRGRA